MNGRKRRLKFAKQEIKAMTVNTSSKVACIENIMSTFLGTFSDTMGALQKLQDEIEDFNKKLDMIESAIINKGANDGITNKDIDMTQNGC
jgi:cell shape-determining protein MreC